jgi:hypothetical protein
MRFCASDQRKTPACNALHRELRGVVVRIGALSGRAHRLTWIAFAPVHAAGAVPNAERAGRARPGFRSGNAALTRSH